MDKAMEAQGPFQGSCVLVACFSRYSPYGVDTQESTHSNHGSMLGVLGGG